MGLVPSLSPGPGWWGLAQGGLQPLFALKVLLHSPVPGRSSQGRSSLGLAGLRLQMPRSRWEMPQTAGRMQDPKFMPLSSSCPL